MKIGPLNISFNRKGFTGGLTFAIRQDSIMYQIGDDPRNYIKDGYLKNPNLFSIISMMVSAFYKGHYELFNITDKEKAEQVTEHPLLDLLQRPNPMFSKKEFIEAAMAYKWVTGESFLYKVRVPIGADKGKVQYLTPLPPHMIEIKQGDNGLPVMFKYSMNLGKYLEIPPEDIIYMRTFNPDGGVRGVSPLCAGREIMAHDNDIITANRKLTNNMGPTGILTLGDPKESSYNQEQLDAFKAKFRQTYQGKDHHGDIYVTGEKTTWTTTGANADDLGIFEASKMTMRELCNIYGISSQLLNDPENKTYSNMQDARKALVTQVIIPQWHLFLASLNSFLVPEFEKIDGKKYELRINKQGWEEIRDEELTHVQALESAYWLTLNEKRKVMGYEPLEIPEGDDIYVPINAMPLSTNTDSASKLRNAYAQASQVSAPKPDDNNKPTDPVK